MTDLIALMSKLVDPQGNILIPGVDDMVSAADAEERLGTTCFPSFLLQKC